MLGKLIKHEFKATFKTFCLLYAALFALTLLTKFCIYIPFDNRLLHIMEIILSLIYIIILVGILLFSFVLVLMRFNNNMLKDQGYLSNTLPVKMWQQITAKTITYVVWVILSIVAVIASLGIFFIGEGTGEVVREIVKGFSRNTELIPMFIIFCLLMIAQLIVNILSFFASLSLGQIFAKHRIAGAVLFYFVLSYALGAVVSVLMVAAQPLSDKIDIISLNSSGLAETLVLAKNSIYAYMGIMFFAEVILGVVYFVITNFMLNRKLNLE